MIDQYTPVQVDFGRGGQHKFLEFDSILLITDQLLQELMTEVKLRGVEIIQRKFENLDDVVALKEEVVMNCTGLGSKKLFNDNNLRGKKGNLLVYKNVNKVNYMLTARHDSGSHVTIYGVGDKLMVGATYLDEPIDSKLDEAHFDSVLRNAQ